MVRVTPRQKICRSESSVNASNLMRSSGIGVCRACAVLHVRTHI